MWAHSGHNAIIFEEDFTHSSQVRWCSLFILCPRYILICQYYLLKSYDKVLRYFFRSFHTYPIKLEIDIARKNIISNFRVISKGLPDIRPYRTYIKLLPIVMTSVFANASSIKCFINSSIFMV